MWGPQRPKFGGFWILDFGDFGVFGFWILGILGILDFGFWILGILDFGFWSFGDFGFWILDFVTNFGCYIRKEDCARRTGSADFICFFPNSFSYGVFANIGSGAASGGQVPGGSGKVPGQVPITRSGKVPGQVPNDRFQEGCGAGSERQVPEQLLNHVQSGFQEVRGSGTGSERQVPGQVPNQVPNHGFRGRVSGDRVPPGRFQNGSGQVSRL